MKITLPKNYILLKKFSFNLLSVNNEYANKI